MPLWALDLATVIIVSIFAWNVTFDSLNEEETLIPYTLGCLYIIGFLYLFSPMSMYRNVDPGQHFTHLFVELVILVCLIFIFRNPCKNFLRRVFSSPPSPTMDIVSYPEVPILPQPVTKEVKPVEPPLQVIKQPAVDKLQVERLVGRQGRTLA